MPHTFNREQLVDRILEKLRVLGEGNPASAEQREKADGVIDSGVAELAHTANVIIAPNDDMEIKWKENLAEFLSFFCAGDFHRPPDIAAKTNAKVSLQQIAALDPTYQSLKVDPLFSQSYRLGDYAPGRGRF